MTDDLDTIRDQLETKVRELNAVLRHAAECDLVVEVSVGPDRQDLQDDVDVRIGTAPLVRATLSRHEGPDVEPEEAGSHP